MRGGSIAIVSPWISNITVEFPVSSRIPYEELSLTDAISQFPENEYLLFTNDSTHNDYFLDRLEENIPVRQLPDLHAKVVVTDELAYIGSANITRKGMSENIEIALIVENDYGSVDAFLDQELDL